MKFALPLIAIVLALACVSPAEAVVRRNVVVQKQVVVNRGVQRVRVQQVVVAQPFVQAVVAQPVYAQQFVAPVYSQQFVAPVQAYSAPVLQFNAGHGCSQFFRAY